jgi:outer membrane protein
MRGVRRGVLGAVVGASLVVGTGLAMRAAAQGQTGVGVAGRVATVDMLMLVERVVMTAPFKVEMEALTGPLAAEMQAIADRQDALVQQATELDKEGEQFKTMQQEYLGLDEQFKQLRTKVQSEIDGLSAKQVQRAFEQVRQAVDALAKQEGYTHVLASRDAAAAFRAVDIPNTLQEVLAKSVVVSPRADDLTEKAIDALGVRDVQPQNGAKPSGEKGSGEQGAGSGKE